MKIQVRDYDGAPDNYDHVGTLPQQVNVQVGRWWDGLRWQRYDIRGNVRYGHNTLSNYELR